MREGYHWLRRLAALVASIMALSLACIVGVATAAYATSEPAAGFSINPSSGLVVNFVATSTGFSHPVTEYDWVFGDGQSEMTQKPAVTHTYQADGTYMPTLTEMDSHGDTAMANGVLELVSCPSGPSTCSGTLTGAGTVQSLQATGPADSGTLQLFEGPDKIPTCQTTIGTAVGVTDSQFTGNLTVSLLYTTSHPKLAARTCFSSPVPFRDSAGKTVHNGLLPSCAKTSSKPPCVESVKISGKNVSKQLIIPPGDPKVGSP